MKTTKYPLIIIATLFLAACNGKQNSNAAEQDSIIQKDTIIQQDTITEQKTEQSQTLNEADVKDSIRKFYNTYVLGSTSLDDATARRYCTLNFCNSLKAAYTDEYCDGEPGYALWLLRTGAQDGPSDDSRVVDIVNSGTDAYEVTYLDMGISGKSLVRIVVEDGKPKMDSVKRL